MIYKKAAGKQERWEATRRAPALMARWIWPETYGMGVVALPRALQEHQESLPCRPSLRLTAFQFGYNDAQSEEQHPPQEGPYGFDHNHCE
jgi:hypothetical protein